MATSEKAYKMQLVVSAKNQIANILDQNEVYATPVTCLALIALACDYMTRCGYTRTQIKQIIDSFINDYLLLDATKLE